MDKLSRTQTTGILLIICVCLLLVCVYGTIKSYRRLQNTQDASLTTLCAIYIIMFCMISAPVAIFLTLLAGCAIFDYNRFCKEILLK